MTPSNSTSLLPRDRKDEFKKMVARIVEDRIQGLMADEQSIFQPFFQPRQIAHAMISRQTVSEKNRWSYYFDDWGCMHCETTEKPHTALGMCQSCYSRIRQRLKSSLLKHAPSSDQPTTFLDTVKLARAALAPSIELLASKAPPSKSHVYRNQREAAKEAGINQETLVRWIATGKVQRPATRLSKAKWLWSDEDIARVKAVKRGSR